MNFQDLNIQTQREAPNNARTQGFATLVRAGFLTRENDLLPLGTHALQHLEELSQSGPFLSLLSLPTIGKGEIYFPLPTGAAGVIHCPDCGYTSRSEWATFAKKMLPPEEALPLEKVSTPECNTIEDLANFLNLPKDKTAKALLVTRVSDGKFVFVVVRGDMQLSEAKLKSQVGEVRPATVKEILASGAEPGYASPIGLKDALIIVDDLIPRSANLVAGANESGYHMKNVNYGRDYKAEITADLAQAGPGNACADCGGPLNELRADPLFEDGRYHFRKILHALAETHHDEYGLTIPHPAAPFDVYLMHIPGRELDTADASKKLSAGLTGAGLSVLLDTRESRAGVKFNDADLIGSPVRITVGERSLKEGMVELKPRTARDKYLVSMQSLEKLTTREHFWELISNTP
jgi:prolyl-tRNA synthetase